jgi:hypothetical protein
LGVGAGPDGPVFDGFPLVADWNGDRCNILIHHQIGIVSDDLQLARFDGNLDTARYATVGLVLAKSRFSILAHSKHPKPAAGR